MLKQSLTILHLCIACSLLLYFLGFPFFGTHFFYRSNLLVIEAAIGERGLPDEIAAKKQAFLEEPASLQELILNKRAFYQAGLTRSWTEQVISALRIIPEVGAPLWLWLFLSFYLGIKLLKGVMFKQSTLLMLPLLSLIIVFHNFNYGTQDPVAKLIPSEAAILKGQKLEGSVAEQIEMLKGKWTDYLLEKWGEPGDQLPIAEQRFQIAWARLLPMDSFSALSERRSPILLAIFVGWNLLFALLAGYQIKDHARKKSDGSA